jgi:O-methyltransferase
MRGWKAIAVNGANAWRARLGNKRRLARTMTNQTAADLYLDLLMRSLTATLYDREPNHDLENAKSFVLSFTKHYIQGNAVTMLPQVRLENIRFCIGQILSDGVPGDLIETGVWRGGGCIFMRGCLKALGHPERVVWVADSFEGLPEPDVNRNKERDFYHSPVMQKAYQKMAAGEEEVRRNFIAYGLLDENVRFLKGWFKNTLRSAAIEKLALIRLDGDFYESTTDALNGLYDKLAPGGFVIIDDYGEDVWTDCRAAVDEFRAAHRVFEPLVHVDSKCSYWRKDRI